MLSDTDGVMFDMPRLAANEKMNLSKILKIDPDGPMLQLIIQALETATIIQKTMGHIGAGRTQAEFRNVLLSLKGHIEEGLRKLREIPDSCLQILEQSCWHTNDYDKSFIAKPKDRSTLIDKQLAILAGINFHLENMSKPSKEKHAHTAGIVFIKNTCSNLFPDIPISAHRNSVFTKLIVFWLVNYLGEKAFIPQRQIEKILG